MNFAAGLPWLPVPVGGLPVPTKIEGISAPVEISAPKTVSIEQEKPLAIPGADSGGLLDNLKGYGAGVWQYFLSLFASSSNSGSGGKSGLADAIKVPWEGLGGAPSNATSGADGKSGDIHQTVNFGDLIARGYKFDLASLPAWVWLAAGGMGLIAFIHANKKGKK